MSIKKGLSTCVILLVIASVLLSGCAAPAANPTAAPAAPTKAAATVAPAAPTAASAATKAPAAATSAPAASGKKKVQVLSWWDFTSSKPLQELKKGFEAKNPDLEMEFIQIGSGYADKVLTMIAGGGDMPDVMMLAMDKLPLFADRGAILNLDKYVSAETKKAVYPVVLQSLSYKGSLYAMPRDVSTRVMYLNKDMFDAAGVPLPKAGWTWAEFREIAKKMTKTDANGQPVQWGFYFPKYNDGFFHFLRQNDGALVSEDGTKSMLSKPESIETLKFLQDMIVKDKSVPTETQAKQFGTSDSAPFIANKVAMVAGSLSTSVAVAKANVKYAVIPLPKGKREMNTAFVNAWSIPKGAKNPDLSWRVLQYFASVEGQQIVLDTGMGLPAVPGVKTDEFYKQHADNHYFVDVMATAEPFPCPLYGVDFFKLVEKEFELMWLGQVTVDDAVKKVEKTSNDILSGKAQ